MLNLVQNTQSRIYRICIQNFCSIFPLSVNITIIILSDTLSQQVHHLCLCYTLSSMKISCFPMPLCVTSSIKVETGLISLPSILVSLSLTIFSQWYDKLHFCLQTFKHFPLNFNQIKIDDYFSNMLMPNKMTQFFHFWNQYIIKMFNFQL